jgi:isoleucyl-tRNA synthetase
VQLARREAGLEISDRIVLRLHGDEELLAAARAHEDWLRGEVLAVEMHCSANGSGRLASIEGRELRISVATV